VCFCVFCGYLFARDQEKARSLDPAGWGNDHVGKPLPEFATGDECLFCHRNNIGSEWAKNWHNLTIREADAETPGRAALSHDPTLKGFAAEATRVLGGRQQLRFLKPSGSYGKLEVLSTAWIPPSGAQPGKLIHTEKPHWDSRTFADGCAGCHATAVDARTRAFASPSLDCFVCHGDVPANHPKEPNLALLARKRNDSARVVTSICAQCHVRTGKSKSTGLPYPNQFVAGDNLFRDFQIEWSDEHLKKLNPADRHVLANVRDVVIRGKEEVTCLSCHEVHKQSTQRHRRLPQAESCLDCHLATGSKKIRPAFEVHSRTCGY
jgi:hypothetical protein